MNPRLHPVPPQPAAQTGMLGLVGAAPGGLAWRFVKRYTINPAAVGTDQFGDIPLPTQGVHAAIIWRARDTSVNNGGSYGGLQVAVQGGTIDTGAQYQWGDNRTNINPAANVPSSSGAGNVNAMFAFVTAGGGQPAAAACIGCIYAWWYNWPINLFGGGTPHFEWRTNFDDPSGPISMTGAGRYNGAQGPVTKLHFFSQANSLERGTTFELWAAMPT